MTDDFWKQKLKAFLHDPPCKCFGISEHENAAESFMKAAGFLEDECKNDPITALCDQTAAAADRFLFPKPGKLNSVFTGDKEFPYFHPFCDGKYISDKEVPSFAYAEEKFQGAIGIVDSSLSWQEKFMLYWRRWPEESSKADSRLGFLPADTRIPDHSIWNHIGLTSAFRTCCENDEIRPAFLLFQIGPVQDFIECARSTRDCWSGSYILSWLMSKALAAVSLEIGPDNVIFPSLRGQSFFDLALKDIYQKIPLKNGKTLWDSISSDIENKLKIPTIPNRFLLLVPASRAEQMAVLAEKAINEEWKKITDSSWNEFSKLTKEDVSFWKDRWQQQTQSFLQIHWQIMEWDLALKNSELEDIAQKIPEQDRDPRYYSDKESKTQVNNPGCTWNLQYERVSKAFSARHMLREFEQFLKENDPRLAGVPKDSLSGSEEIIGSEKIWTELRSDKADSVFKKNEGPYGSISIIKRLFPKYLGHAIPGFTTRFEIQSTKEIAGDRKYFAVIAMDGDEIGKRLSGGKAKLFIDSLSKNAREYFKQIPDFANYRRAMSPSAHAQFSECLSNFALHLVDPIIQSFGGQLIYAGGDDVLAMVPAQNALCAAFALRCFFRGESPELLKSSPELARQMNVFKSLDLREKQKGWAFVPVGNETLPLMVPGADSDVSCGIAIAHEAFPLQRAIHEARAAEKRAKNEFLRSAFAVSLLKRSGEIIQWGAKWDSSAMELFYSYYQAVQEENAGNRFPYTLAQLLQPYDLEHLQDDQDSDQIKEIILAEFIGLCRRQWPKPPFSSVKKYLDEIQKVYGAVGFHVFSKIFLSVAFIFRDNESEE